MKPDRVFFAASFIYYYENGNRRNNTPEIECLRTISPNVGVDDGDVEKCLWDNKTDKLEELILSIVDSNVLNVTADEESKHKIIVWLVGKINNVIITRKDGVDILDFELIESVIDFG